MKSSAIKYLTKSPILRAANDNYRLYLIKPAPDTTSQSTPYSTNGQTHTWTYTYDSLGHVLTVTDPLTHANGQTHTWTYTYDSLGHVLTVTDPLTHATGLAYDAQDNKTSVTDPRTLVTSYVYDGFGQVIQERCFCIRRYKRSTNSSGFAWHSSRISSRKN